MESLLEFLSANQKIIIGAAATVAELIVIAVNLPRRLKKRKQQMSALFASSNSPTFLRNLGWSVLPWNLFRKP